MEDKATSNISSEVERSQVEEMPRSEKELQIDDGNSVECIRDEISSNKEFKLRNDIATPVPILQGDPPKVFIRVVTLLERYSATNIIFCRIPFL
jgi:hypothetical protein